MPPGRAQPRLGAGSAVPTHSSTASRQPSVSSQHLGEALLAALGDDVGAPNS